MTVSVVVTSYNYGRFLRDCLDSILRQTYQDFDIVVVDDGSTDDTAAVVKPYLSSRVRYHYQVNQGQAAAKNAGIRLTSGEVVAFLDADDMWEPEKLERQLPLLANPNVGVAYTAARAVDIEGSPVQVPARSGYMTFRRGNITKWLAFENIVPFSAAAVRRSLLIDHGGFDESLTMGIDWDLWLRLSCYTEFDFVPERLFIYRLHGAQMSHNLEGRVKGSETFFQNFLDAHPEALSPADLSKVRFYNYCGRAYKFRGIDRRRSNAYFLKALRVKPWSHVAYVGLLKNAVGVLRG